MNKHNNQQWGRAWRARTNTVAVMGTGRKQTTCARSEDEGNKKGKDGKGGDKH